MNPFKISFLLAITLIMIQCKSSYKVISDKESNINFSRYTSFNIIDHNHNFPLGANPINKQRIERAVINELEKLGYEQKNDCDLIVAWFVKVDTKYEEAIYTNYYNRYIVSEKIDIYEYQQGTLVIDLIDSKTKQVIWHGRVTNRIYENMPDIEQKIYKVVKDMFKRYKKDTKYGKALAYN